MKFRQIAVITLGTISCISVKAGPQEPALIPLSSEPHHHLALHNEYVNVYKVYVAPHDSVRLHRHDRDAISLMLSDALVTVHTPGKPDAPSKLTNGQVRLQRKGYVHSTSIEGDMLYRNVTVELLQPQTGARNLCAQVIPKEPLNCLGAQLGGSGAQPQFATDETYIRLIRLPSHQSVTFADSEQFQLVVALDAGAAHEPGGPSGKSLEAGDFVWLSRGDRDAIFKNGTENEVRLVDFALKPKP